MSNKDYPEYISNSLQSCDKNIIVEELLEKLKAQGCFDAKRKQFLSEITNKSAYQNLHTKVENLATKFLETVRWPPSVQKHQLREQLRLHIQSTDQFNNSVSRLIEQEVNCKIQAELKPMIESKACEYLEVNYEKWKQSMLSQIYENFQVDSPVEKFSHKIDIKKELVHSVSKTDVDNDGEVTQSIEVGSLKNIKLESTLSQSNVVNSSSCNSNTQSQPKYSAISSHRSPQTIHSNFVGTATVSPAMPPPIGLLPPPHRILPNNLFQPLPPPPPPMFLPLDRFPPPPPPEDKSLPPPPPPENGPNTPTEEYIPKFYEVENAVEKVKAGLLKTPDKSAIDKTPEVKIFSPKKLIWGNIVLPIQDISDDSASDSDKNEHERRRYSRKSPPISRSSNANRDEPTRHLDDWRPQKDSWRSHDSRSHWQPSSASSTTAPSTVAVASTASAAAAGSSSLHHCRQKSNDYTDVSSESFTELEFKDVPQSSTSVVTTGAAAGGSGGGGGHNNSGGGKKQSGGGSAPGTAGGAPAMSSSSDDDNHSSSSNDHTLNLIRKINKKKTKMRKSRKTPTLVQSSSSYSSSESSSESSSTEHSQRKQMTTNYRDVQRGYRVFGRSQSEEKDMDISVDTQSPLTDLKWNSPKAEINLDSMESVQIRKNQIKARLEEIDAKRSLLQKQQLLTTADPGSASNTTSSSSTDSSSDNNTTSTPSSGHSAGAAKTRDKEAKKSLDGQSKLLTSPSQHGQIFENVSIFGQGVKKETMSNDEHDDKIEHDSEPEEGELSSESRSGSMKRDNRTKSPEGTSMCTDNLKIEDIRSMSDNNMLTGTMKKEIEEVHEAMYGDDK